jgi:hypothetical protein
MDFLSAAKTLGSKLENIPIIWDGKKSILEMKAAGYPHWKQMEWIGFYFQFLCEQYLSEVVQIPGPQYGNVRFDGFYNIPWDFKVHVTNSNIHKIIVNDRVAIDSGIKQYGSVGLIIACGKALYNDESGVFKKWHDVLKGGKSAYEIERIARGARSRLRKVSLDLEKICFVSITSGTLLKSGSFQENFRNSNGTPRNSKLLINLSDLENEIEYEIEV